jgi:hypothetical protein
MNYSQPIQFLLEHGCPSIAYRTKKEIQGEALNTTDLLNLQKLIQIDPEVKRIFSLQKEDGWLGGLFHGTDEPESGIRYLCEKGIATDHPVIIQALNAIEMRAKDFDDGGLVRVGKLLDDYHLGGSQMIKACVFAYAGHEEAPFIKNQIDEALSAFHYVSKLQNIEDVFIQYKNKLVFKQTVKWPSIYHLRLLAFTHSWRNSENLEMLKTAFHKLIEFSPIPNIKLLHKSQIISPASVFMNDFNINIDNIKDKDWMMWFHRTEMIARLGIAGEIEAINKQINALQYMLFESEGFFRKELSHYYFHKWTQYIGLALENDWKSEEKRICDLTFRSLLILKLSGNITNHH